MPQQPAKPASASFLDEWFNKRKAPAKPLTSPFNTPSAANASPAPPPQSFAAPAPMSAPMPAAAPVPPPRPAAETRNISSDALEKSEVDSIAKSLKQEEQSLEASVNSMAQALPVVQPQAPQPVDHQQVSVKLRQEQKTADTGHLSSGDTIYFDQGGAGQRENESKQ
jgi:hypothetical protein